MQKTTCYVNVIYLIAIIMYNFISEMDAKLNSTVT